MRTTMLAVLILGLMTSPALAIRHGGGGGGNVKYATLNVVNNVDGAVDVSVNGEYVFTLEPLQNAAYAVPIFKGNKANVALTATLTASPSVSATGSATIQSGGTATATITSPTSSTLAIAFSGSGLVGNFGREGGVMLASTGGLLPLLWMSFLLGRTPRRRDGFADGPSNLDCQRVSD